MEIEVDIHELADGRYLVELSSRGDVLGPLTAKELEALHEALALWMEEGEY